MLCLLLSLSLDISESLSVSLSEGDSLGDDLTLSESELLQSSSGVPVRNPTLLLREGLLLQLLALSSLSLSGGSVRFAVVAILLSPGLPARFRTPPILDA